MKNKIIIIGAGAWGTALANLLAKNNSANSSICLIANKPQIVDEINQKNSNHEFLPNINLSYNLKSSQNLEDEALQADFIFVVTPSNKTAELLQKISKLKLKENCGLIICSKGLEISSLKFFHQIVEEILPHKKYATLSGPNFASEVAEGLATISTIAALDKNFALQISSLLKNQNFKTEICDDVLAAEICGVVKNIMAIGCGIIDGLNLGQNAKAALVIQGIREIEILCHKLQSKAQINNAAGFGDIFLTCSSNKSRNNSLGIAIAQDQKPLELLNGKKTFEGAIGAKAIEKLAAKLSLELPLCKNISYILQNNLAKEEIKSSIIRSLML